MDRSRFVTVEATEVFAGRLVSRRHFGTWIIGMQCPLQLQFVLARLDLHQHHQKLWPKEKQLANHPQRISRLLFSVVRPVTNDSRSSVGFTNISQSRINYLLDKETSSLSFLLCYLFQFNSLSEFFTKSKMCLQLNKLLISRRSGMENKMWRYD